jgi:hypothetical protein
MNPMSVVYDDPEITSLSEGLRILPTVPHPFLRIRYTLSLKEFHTDPIFSRLVRHEKNGTFRLTFPTCASVTNIRMNRACRMVTYYRDKKTRYLQEIQVTRHTHLFLQEYPSTEITIYIEDHKNHKDLVLSFDLYLARSKL